MIPWVAAMDSRSIVLATDAPRSRIELDHLDMDLAIWQSGEYVFHGRDQGPGQRTSPPDPRLAQAAAPHFPPQVDGDLVADGVCGVFIAQKLGSAATASEHLKILSRAGLVRRSG